MSNRIVITNSSEFEQVISVFESTLSDIKKSFENELKITAAIDDNEIWKGEANKAFTKKYGELAKNFQVIEDSIEVYIKFLKKALQDYEEMDKKISSAAEKVTDRLNIVS